MTKTTCLIIVFALFNLCNSIFAQNPFDFIKKTAIPVDSFNKLPNSLHDQLKSFRLIMVGEMHGTKEPAELVIGLTKLITENHDSLVVGFEIPLQLMPTSFGTNIEKEVYQSAFFKSTSKDGRANSAWAKAIIEVVKNPMAEIFFFDDNESYGNKRDSIMYLKIKEKMSSNPNKKFITISGNIHNQLANYNNKPTTAQFLQYDEELNLTAQICSFNHIYHGGTMLNNMGEGLALQKVNPTDSPFSQATQFDNYLLLDLTPFRLPYTAFFYSKLVTAADLIPN